MVFVLSVLAVVWVLSMDFEAEAAGAELRLSAADMVGRVLLWQAPRNRITGQMA